MTTTKGREMKPLHQQMEQLGAEHARAGKQCTPFDCQAIDAKIFALSREAAAGKAGMEKSIAEARAYRQLRGAFNKGWQAEYFRLTCVAA